jgi:hypothetical protein
MVQSIQAHDGVMWALRASADGSMVASGGQDGVVRVWRVLEGGRGMEPGAYAVCVYVFVHVCMRAYVYGGCWRGGRGMEPHEYLCSECTSVRFCVCVRVCVCVRMHACMHMCAEGSGLGTRHGAWSVRVVRSCSCACLLACMHMCV